MNPCQGGEIMATFLMLGKYAPEAIKKISAERTDKAAKLAKKFQGSITNMFATLGEFDLLLIADFPGTDKAMQFSVSLAKQTGIAFTTYPALTVADFDKLMAEV
jgi:uncharacterized protein with GYD domain